jgi:hypothetical protein
MHTILVGRKVKKHRIQRVLATQPKLKTQQKAHLRLLMTRRRKQCNTKATRNNIDFFFLAAVFEMGHRGHDSLLLWVNGSREEWY